MVVFSYDTLGLLSHILDADQGFGLHLNAQIVLGVATPILLLGYWGVIRLIRAKFHE